MGWKIDHDRPAIEHGPAALADALITGPRTPAEQPR
jgi:hypothetical protein